MIIDKIDQAVPNLNTFFREQLILLIRFFQFPYFSLPFIMKYIYGRKAELIFFTSETSKEFV